MRLKIFIVLFAVFTASGCAPPIGTIGSSAYDSMWTVPYRVVYDINDKFERFSDVSIFASYRGAIQPIPVNKVNISVIEDPDWSELENPVPTDTDYPFLITGRKVIIVKYRGLEARYSIDVRDPFGLGGGNQNNEGSGIIIIWATP